MLKKLSLSRLNELMTKADKLAVLTILGVSVILLFLTPRIVANRTSNQRDVVVRLEEEEIYREELRDASQEERSEFDFMIEGEEYQGVLRMKEGKVRLERLSEDISPLSIHADMGWISEPYQMIVCMPIRLTVEIETQEEVEEEVDVRTY